MGPMVAAGAFLDLVRQHASDRADQADCRILCTLKGSLAFTGRGHATDRAVALGLHGFSAEDLADQDVDAIVERLWERRTIPLDGMHSLLFSPQEDIVFDEGEPLPQHPNGLIFEMINQAGETILSETYFSTGGGFIITLAEMDQQSTSSMGVPVESCPYPFPSASAMLEMAKESQLSIAAMKRINELAFMPEHALDPGLDAIWHAMQLCVERGLTTKGTLPGGLGLSRRAKDLHDQLQMQPEGANLTEWLSAYALAVNEENAAGHMVVTAPTNGAAGVIPAVLNYFVNHEGGSIEQVREFLLTAAAIGGIIKHRGSISGAEVGCQGEIGSAASMAAAGLCAVWGGSPAQIENAAEIALEHHLGLTCDPVLGLVQVPCIERNAFGAIKAYTAASLSIRGTGRHTIPLDGCIAAMKQTGLEMSEKFKETSLGGLAVSITEC